MMSLSSGLATVYGQANERQVIHLSLGFVDYELRAPYERVFIQGGSRSRVSAIERIPTSAPAVGVGYSFPLKGRWHLALEGRYAWTKTVHKEDFWEEYRLNHPSLPATFRFQAPRQFNGLFGNAIFFLQAARRPLFSADVGIGFSFSVRWHQYRSGFELNELTQQFEKEIYSTERVAAVGVPVVLRLGTPLTDAVRLAVEFGVTPYYTGELVKGVNMQVVFILKD